MSGHVHTSEPWARPRHPWSSDDRLPLHHVELYVFGLLAFFVVGERIVIAFMDVTDMHGRYRTRPKREA